MIDWVKVRQENNDFFFHYKNYTPVGILPKQAALDTIDYIQKNYPPPYTLMLSGGVDSQAMLYAWIISGVPFRTFSGRYNGNANQQDLRTLDCFAKNFSIQINYVDLDVLQFFQTEYVDYVNKYRCGSPHILTFIKMIEMITEGTPILAGNFCTGDAPGRPLVDKNNFALYRYSLHAKKPLVPFFFTETRELYYSFYEQERKRRLIRNFDVKDPVAIYMNKVDTYQRNGFPVIPQEYKMTGFESIKDYYDKHFSHLVTPQDRIARNQTQKSNRTFDLLLRNKYELKFDADKYLHRNFL